ncbi:siderophore biosynthesis protein [Methylopila turkensis]|uniref:Siderophore biosynthesis protein n=2 Tax=Methylopila turkensis TaxID=1437816 RepID=A0A9W6JKP4_9HYPH|nr:siderophore biosynthesis protein [Methylopila turkensis]
MSGEWAPLARLWGPDRSAMERLLAHQRSYAADLDEKGQSAYLIGGHAYALAVPLALGVVAHGVAFDLSADRIGFRLERYVMAYGGRDAPGERMHLRLSSPSFATVDPAHAGVAGAVLLPDRAALAGHVGIALEAHLAPLVEWLHGYGGLSRGALWRLVGDAVAMAFLGVGEALGRVEDAKRDALGVLKRPGSPLNNPQMRFARFDLVHSSAPDRPIASENVCVRGGCCRYYTVEGGSYCGSCVMLDAREREARMLAAFRLRLGEAACAGAAAREAR